MIQLLQNTQLQKNNIVIIEEQIVVSLSCILVLSFYSIGEQRIKLRTFVLQLYHLITCVTEEQQN